MTAANKTRKYRSRLGFTTIELVVVIGIIVILVGLVFAAMRGTTSSAKRLTTHGTLNNLAGMLGELEAANGLSRQPAAWLWTEDGKTIIRVSVNTSNPNLWVYDFWKGPTITGANPITYEPLASPGSVLEDGGRDTTGFHHPTGMYQRNGSIAMVNTMLAMTMIAANPANRSRLQAMPQPQQFALTWHSSMDAFGGMVIMPGTDMFNEYQPTGNASVEDPITDQQFVPGVHIRYDDRYYVATPSYTAGSAAPVPKNNAAKAPGAPWWDETDAPFHAPMLLDAWNNPIIFVPASGIRVRLLNGQKNYDVKDATQNWIIVSPEGEVTANGTATPQVIKQGRPFFASAGPDGDFSTGDDNVYSFEK